MAWNYSNTSMETSLTASITNVQTSITVGSVSGFPASFPYSLILDFEQPNVEVVTVTAAAGTTLTVTRAQDGTTGQTHDLGARVVHGLVARDVREPQQHIAAVDNVHGLPPGSGFVGTLATQTLTNKTIDGSVNTLSNIPDSAITAVSANKVTQPFPNLESNGQVTVTRAAAIDHSYRSKVTGDLDHRLIARADGMLIWGTGAATGDTNLYRPAANVLKTDDDFEAAGGLSTSGAVKSTRPTSGDHIMRGQTTPDTEFRFTVDAVGKMEWGNGTAARDTNLYRWAANVLKTDDDFEVAGNLTVTGVGGFLFARKTADEIVSNSTTAQDDDHLFVTVQPNAVYAVDSYIAYASLGTPDLKMEWTAPAGASFRWTIFGLAVGATGFDDEIRMDSFVGQSQVGGVLGTDLGAMPRGTLTVGGTGGTFRLRWAQNTATADNTVLRAGSWLRLQRIA